MRRFFVLACVLCGFVTGCSDSFNPPPLPDLGKVPYDFGVAVPPYTGDMGVGDLSTTD